ncbi:MAG: hypothetical protein HFJ72_03705 [Adlercreutzia sp.]|uniref:hypothetical protein n=1 Tax=uncultured Adlercreutzia sp. TaxID=875803 RepID=UPI00216EBDCB|nr:hypothetical protein [uncultured Adlercreutzia sp.]MCI8424750.1 hypothetical protein [Adlercreutzia sp.]
MRTQGIKRRIFNGALAAVLACGLMLPTTGLTAWADEPNDAPAAEAAEGTAGSSTDFDTEVGEGASVDAPASEEEAGEAVDADAAPAADDSVEDGKAEEKTNTVHAVVAHVASTVASYEAVANPAAALAAAAPAPQADGWTVVGDFQVQGGTAGTESGSGDYYHDGAILHIQSSKPLTVKMADGKASTAQTIDIDQGVKADLTLAGVNISTTVRSPINMITNVYDIAENDGKPEGSKVKATHADQIRNKTMLYLTIADGTTNNLLFTRTDTTASTGWPGIRCGWGSVLVIDDSIANVKAGGSKFNLEDIVTPVNGLIGSDQTLLGGTVLKAGDAIGKMSPSKPGVLVAQGGLHSAGIGSGPSENAGTLIINGGDITAKMSLNDYVFNGSAIGGGGNGSGTVITINGGDIKAYGAGCGTAIGAGFGYHTAGHNGSTFKADAIGVPTSINSYALSSGYSFWAVSKAPYTYSANGTDDLANSNVQTGTTVSSHTVAGDITINGGYVYAKSGIHGNAIGQSCGHGPNTNRGHIIRITGGTVVSESQTPGNTNPYMFGIGARLGYTIVTGGSVYVQKGTSSAYNGKVLFQGLGGTAYNTLGVTTWDDVVRVAEGDPVSDAGYTGKKLPDGDKVQMLEINLSEDVKADGKVPDKVTVTKWELKIDNKVYDYGAPTYLDKGKAYVWVPSSATGKNVTVTMSYLDANGVEKNIEPLYVEEVGGSSGSTLKRYIDIDVEKLPEETKDYFHSLKKEYDGKTLAPFDIAKNPIDTTQFEAVGKTLNDPTKVSVTYQQYDAVDGNPVGDSVSDNTMPADTGIFRVQFVSSQYATGDFGNSYWGHRITGWAEITPVPAVLDLEGVEWGYLNEATGAWSQITQDQVDAGEAGNRLKLTFDIRGANTTATTCAAPTGSFQVKIDGKNVGDPIPLTEAAFQASKWSTIAQQQVDAPTTTGGTEKRNATVVTYYLDPTNRDGLLDLLELAGNGGEHKVNIEYIPDKNYIEGVDKNPDNAGEDDTFIVPVPPKGEVKPDDADKDKVVIEDTPNPKPQPGDPDYVDPNKPTDPSAPANKTTVIRKTISVDYSKFHSVDEEVADFFSVAVKSTSSVKPEFSVSNSAVADIVRGEDGDIGLDADGKLKLQVNSCGTSVITVTQKANALYTGITYILTVNVTPDPALRPKVQIRLTSRNLTALAEAGAPAVARIAEAVLPVAAPLAAVPAAQATSDRASLPPRPGDVMEYTVTGLNLTDGSSWQAAELKDAIGQNLVFDPSSVELAANYPTHSRQYSLGTTEFYRDFDWASLPWSDVKSSDYTFSAQTLSKLIGNVYGGQSTSVRFQATVAEGTGDRPENGKVPTIETVPEGGGGFGKPETQPGEEVTNPQPLKPGEDIVFVGDGGTNPDNPTDPVDPDKGSKTEVLPKDPTAADISTEVKTELIGTEVTHEPDRVLVGDTLKVTATSTNNAPDSKLVDGVIKVTLPKGAELKGGTIKLTDAEGNVHEVPDSAYDPKTGTVAVNIGDLYGGESAELTFEVEITSTKDTRPPDGGDGDDGNGEDPDDPSNPGGSGRPDDFPIGGSTQGGTPSGEYDKTHPNGPDGGEEPYDKPEPGTPYVPTDGDGDEELIVTPPSTDPGALPVLPKDPVVGGPEADITVTKMAANTSREEEETHVGDVIRYTVTLANAKPHSMWYGAVFVDELPKGMEPVAGTIRVTGPDGVEREVPDEAYDPSTRILAVEAGDLAGERSAVLVFDALVTEDAIGADIGNTATAYGTKPSEADPSGVVGDSASRPTPGAPFTPDRGWDAFFRENQGAGVSNAEAAYPAGTDAKGGVLAAADGDGSGAGDGSGKGDGKKTIASKTKLAKTGDENGTALASLAVMAAGAFALLIVALRRNRAERRRATRRW